MINNATHKAVRGFAAWQSTTLRQAVIAIVRMRRFATRNLPTGLQL